MSHKVSVVIDKDEDGYYAYCAELPGCQTQGNTFEEVMAHMKETAEICLETLHAEEKQSLAKRQIVTTALEVSVA